MVLLQNRFLRETTTIRINGLKATTVYNEIKCGEHATTIAKELHNNGLLGIYQASDENLPHVTFAIAPKRNITQYEDYVDAFLDELAAMPQEITTKIFTSVEAPYRTKRRRNSDKVASHLESLGTQISDLNNDLSDAPTKANAWNRPPSVILGKQEQRSPSPVSFAEGTKDSDSKRTSTSKSGKSQKSKTSSSSYGSSQQSLYTLEEVQSIIEEKTKSLRKELKSELIATTKAEVTKAVAAATAAQGSVITTQNDNILKLMSAISEKLGIDAKAIIDSSSPPTDQSQMQIDTAETTTGKNTTEMATNTENAPAEVVAQSTNNNDRHTAQKTRQQIQRPSVQESSLARAAKIHQVTTTNESIEIDFQPEKINPEPPDEEEKFEDTMEHQEEMELFAEDDAEADKLAAETPTEKVSLFEKFTVPDTQTKTLKSPYKANQHPAEPIPMNDDISIGSTESREYIEDHQANLRIRHFRAQDQRDIQKLRQELDLPLDPSPEAHMPPYVPDPPRYYLKQMYGPRHKRYGRAAIQPYYTKEERIGAEVSYYKEQKAMEAYGSPILKSKTPTPHSPSLIGSAATATSSTFSPIREARNLTDEFKLVPLKNRRRRNDKLKTPTGLKQGAGGTQHE